MVKPWLVIKHEYGTMVRKRSFLLSTLGVPALIVVIMAISIFFASGSSDERPLGYVDQSGVISAQPQVAASQDQPVAIMPFADEQAARDALAAGTIQGFYLLPADYQQTGQVTLYYGQDLPGQDVRDSFDVFLRTNLAAGQAPDVRQRLVSGVDVTVRSADGRREFSEAGVLNILLPFAAGFFFIYAVLASSGYLLQAVTAEKENRTVEIMATSLSPLQLIGGKALGLMAVALTQLLVWAVALVIGLVAAAQFFPEVRAVEIPWGLLGIVLFWFVPSYALMAGLMISIGSTVTEMQQGQQIAGILNLLFVFPFFLTVMIFTSPNSPLMVLLTLFPTTSFLTVSMRWAVTAIPLWQLAASWILLVISAGVSIWAASRIFRVGMLRYGQRLELRGVLAAIRGRPA